MRNSVYEREKRDRERNLGSFAAACARRDEQAGSASSKTGAARVLVRTRVHCTVVKVVLKYTSSVQTDRRRQLWVGESVNFCARVCVCACPTSVHMLIICIRCMCVYMYYYTHRHTCTLRKRNELCVQRRARPCFVQPDTLTLLQPITYKWRPACGRVRAWTSQPVTGHVSPQTLNYHNFILKRTSMFSGSRQPRVGGQLGQLPRDTVIRTSFKTFLLVPPPFCFALSQCIRRNEWRIQLFRIFLSFCSTRRVFSTVFTTSSFVILRVQGILRIRRQPHISTSLWFLRLQQSRYFCAVRHKSQRQKESFK